MKHLAYLDHNATTQIRPDARDLWVHVACEVGNASSVHSFGRAARKHVEDARNRIAALLDVSPGQIFFNGGATEGNNTVLCGLPAAGRRILVSAIEHPSVLESGARTETIPVRPDGVVDMEAFLAQLKGEPPALVSVMLVNNETGVVQPVAEIAAAAKKVGALVHCDAVQGFGRVAFTREELGVDFLTLSSHKIGGPQGVGALVVAPRIPVPVLLRGGGQERRHRAGTENVAGIAAFGLASLQAVSAIPDFEKLALLRERIEESVLSSSPRVTIWGRDARRVANTTLLTLRGGSGETLLMALDLEGVAVSGGSACSSGTPHPSHVLKAMGADEEDAAGALRISLGWSSTEQDVDAFLQAWTRIGARARP